MARTERDELLHDIRSDEDRIFGRRTFKSNFGPNHPKVTITLSSEFESFPERLFDQAEDDNELAILDILSRAGPRGLRRWRFDQQLRQDGLSITDTRSAIQSLHDRGVIESHRARSAR